MRIVDVHFQAFTSINSVIFVVKICILYSIQMYFVRGHCPRSCQSTGEVAPVAPMLPPPMTLINLWCMCVHGWGGGGGGDRKRSSYLEGKGSTEPSSRIIMLN